MNKIFNYFDDAYYINLDYREDRKDRFEQRSNKIGLNAKRFSAIQPNIEDCTHIPYWNEMKTYEQKRYKANEVGCALSHISIIKEAKNRNLNNILIFEDDCIFLDNFETDIYKCIEDLKNIDWDIFYLGGQPNSACEKVTENIYTIKSGGLYQLHSYAINKSIFDLIINMDFTFCSIIDNFFLNYDKNIIKTYLSKNMLTLQEDGISDLNNLNFNHLAYKVRWDKYVK